MIERLFHAESPRSDNYLKKQAGQDVSKRVSVCFVLTPEGRTIAGFYTLSQYAVDLAGCRQSWQVNCPGIRWFVSFLQGCVTPDRLHC